ncbi:MAG: diguanylate cyclase [Candidatus Eremiobacteraeota bacterium]|nr:diguanylate cyclase [Candidatus Eremiobacteraeota bacterium]MCW5866408.1 diguanylate cyclase [Candidatus Eremiobacteraeota bacterium]
MDNMTGLLDAGVFQERLEEELKRAARFQRPLALLVASWSHQGPQAFDRRTVKSYGPIRKLSTIIKKGLRDVDAAGRMDGEILAAVLPETDLAGARIVAERICREAENYEFPGESLDDLIKLTVNVAIVAHPEHGADAQVLIAEARVALERAQHDGYGLVYEGERPIVS